MVSTLLVLHGYQTAFDHSSGACGREGRIRVLCAFCAEVMHTRLRILAAV